MVNSGLLRNVDGANVSTKALLSVRAATALTMSNVLVKTLVSAAFIVPPVFITIENYRYRSIFSKRKLKIFEQANINKKQNFSFDSK